MTEQSNDNLVLFPKTLDYYQIHLTKMLETEAYGQAKGLLNFLLLCSGEAVKHHTEWQALLGWLEAAFPNIQATTFETDRDDLDHQQEEQDLLKRHVLERFEADEHFVGKLLKQLHQEGNPAKKMLVLSQLMYIPHAGIATNLEQWLKDESHLPALQFRALQVLRQQGCTGTISFWRDGKRELVKAEQTPLSFNDFPQAIHQVIERVREVTEVADPTMAYLAEEMWKEFVEVAYGTEVFENMTIAEDKNYAIWAAALHQVINKELQGKTDDCALRELYGITKSLRFQYEQALRWLQKYAGAVKLFEEP